MDMADEGGKVDRADDRAVDLAVLGLAKRQLRLAVRKRQNIGSVPGLRERRQARESDPRRPP